jgi:hypothetical protein
MKIRRHAFKFYGRFAAAYGTLWLAMLLAAWVTQSSINAGIYGRFGFPALALFYAFVRALTDGNPGETAAEPKPRFSLRGLFVVIAFAALLLAWWRDHWRLAERDVVSEFLLKESRARVDAEFESLQRVANLLDAPVGYERRDGVESPSFGNLRHVTSIQLPQVTITDQQISPLIEHLRALPRLRIVDISQTPRLSPAQLDKLRAALPNVDFGGPLFSSPGRQQHQNKVYPQERSSAAAR